MKQGGSVLQYRLVHKEGFYYYGTETTQYQTLSHLIAVKGQALGWRYPCAKRSSTETEFWSTSRLVNGSPTPISLKEMIFRFIYTSPHLFSDLKQQTTLPLELVDQYHASVVDSLTTDVVGRDMWKRYFLGKELVPWAIFSKNLYLFLEIGEEAKYATLRCMYMAFVDLGGNDLVSLNNFSAFLSWFGPLDLQLPLRVTNMVTKVWFHGNMDHTEAEKTIQQSGAQKGTFLIRYSTKRKGMFNITVFGRKGMFLHYRVPYDKEKQRLSIGQQHFATFDDLIASLQRDLYLLHPCPASKFRSLQEDIQP